MSTQTKLGKLISRFEIGFDNETKFAIDALNAKLDEINKSLNAKDSHGVDGLLKAMQAEAANDSNGVVHHGENVKPELKQLGQWVFDNLPVRFISAALDKNGDGYAYSCDKSILRLCPLGLSHKGDFDTLLMGIGGGFDTSNWKNSAINRETINDVEYLTENVPTIQAMDASEIVVDELQSNWLSEWLSESVPQITQADMQLIFIKNLTTTLIQRMHSMDRFSEDDYHIGGDKLMVWDCLIEAETGRFGLVSGIGFENRTAIINTFNQDFNGEFFAAAYTLDLSFLKKTSVRTITVNEVVDFKAALEACYA